MTNTTTIITSALLAAAVGCESSTEKRGPKKPPETAAKAPSPGDKKPPTKPGKKTMSPIELTWSLSRADDGKSLVLSYEIENPGDSPIYVVDDHAKTTTAGLEVQPNAVAVLPGTDDKTARLVLGHVRPPPGTAVAVEAIAPPHELKAGSKHSGTKTVPLPLKGWIEARSQAVDLSGATRATLEVTWIKPPPADREDWAWEVQKDASGKTIRTPFVGYVNTMGGQAQGDPVAIP